MLAVKSRKTAKKSVFFRKKIKERERAKVGDNDGQATHGARKPPGPK